MKLIGHNPAGLGIANAFAIASLMDLLIDKGVMTKSDAITVLSNATKPLMKDSNTISVDDAIKVLLKMQVPFAE